MNLVQIDGSADALDAVRAMPDLILLGGKELEGGQSRLSGYVPTATIPAIEALGATVTLIKNEAELDAETEELFALLEDEEPPTG